MERNRIYSELIKRTPVKMKGVRLLLSFLMWYGYLLKVDVFQQFD